ncbi:hypothetical protein ACHQM5_007301 [Ranunculus cassubicifolius]
MSSQLNLELIRMVYDVLVRTYAVNDMRNLIPHIFKDLHVLRGREGMTTSCFLAPLYLVITPDRQVRRNLMQTNVYVSGVSNYSWFTKVG